MIIGKSLVPQGQIFESSATKLKAKTLTDFSNKYRMFWVFSNCFGVAQELRTMDFLIV